MEIHEFIALSRSGHHAMMNWIIQNLVGFQLEWKFKITRLAETNVYFFNEGNYESQFSFDFIDENINDIKTLLIGYEDVENDYSIFSSDLIFHGPVSKIKYSDQGATSKSRVIFIRDFFNNLSSRIRANKNKEMFVKVGGNPHIFDVGHEFIKQWKSLARTIVESNHPHLKFEDWLGNPNLRNNFLLENFKTHDRFGVSNIVGTSSSFGESKNYNKRFDPDLIPEEIKEIVRKDSELHYLIGRLGYEFRKI